MKVIKVYRIIDRRSLEARDYDFSVGAGDGEIFGDVKLIWNEFKCLECQYQISIGKLRALQRQKS